MAYVTKKTLPGAVSRKTGKRKADRTAWLAKWLENGRERERSFPTEAEALTFAAGKTVEAGTRRLKPVEVRALRKTFSAVADEWVESLKEATANRGALREHTIGSHKGRLAHAKTVFGDKAVHLIDDGDFELLRAYLMGRPIIRKTQRESLRVARKALAYARDLGLIERVPGEGVTIARTDDEREAERDYHDLVPFTPGEVYTLLRAADDLAANPPKGTQTMTWVRGRGLVYLMAYTGLRCSEARALSRTCLMLDGARRSVKVVRSADLAGKLNNVKTKYGRRTVPLPLNAVEPIREALQVHNYDLAFASDEGTVMHDGNLRTRYLKRLIAHADAMAKDMAKADPRLVPVRSLGWHSFRHAYAAQVIATTRNIKKLQVWLGHHSVSFTLDRYGHLVDEGDDMMDKLDL